MTKSVSRRAFLRRSSGRAIPIRPPWSLAEAEFRDRCTRCGDCAKACPEKIIIDVGGLPQIDFRKGGYTFCGDCVKACAEGAIVQPESYDNLSRDNLSNGAVWNLRPHFSSSCLAQSGTECRVCGECCEAE